MISFLDRLAEVQRRNNSMLCVGLDPDPSIIQDKYLEPWLEDVIAATASYAAAFKPNLPYFLSFGQRGLGCLEFLRAIVPAAIPIIIDGKFGDVGHTAEITANLVFGRWKADGVILNGYGGTESLSPYAREDRGIFVWLVSSGPGASDFMISSPSDPEHKPYIDMAGRVGLNLNLQANFVVGANRLDEMRVARSITPTRTLLVPGFFQQGGKIRDAVQAAYLADAPRPLFAVSRALLYQDNKKPQQLRTITRFAERLRADINTCWEALAEGKEIPLYIA